MRAVAVGQQQQPVALGCRLDMDDLTPLAVRLAYSERYASLRAAVKRERQLKRWTHANRAALVAGDTERPRSLSQGAHTQSLLTERNRKQLCVLEMKP